MTGLTSTPTKFKQAFGTDASDDSTLLLNATGLAGVESSFELAWKTEAFAPSWHAMLSRIHERSTS